MAKSQICFGVIVGLPRRPIIFLKRTRAFQSTAGCRSLTLVGWRDAASPICQMWRMAASWCRRLAENFAKFKPSRHSGMRLQAMSISSNHALAGLGPRTRSPPRACGFSS